MKWIQRFKVTGHSAFPLDMMRYDRCWPQFEAEIWAMMDGSMGTRTISIARYTSTKSDMPTVARWASFGWHVHEVVTEKYN